MAELLVDSMASPWDPSRYEDTHRAKVSALVEEKRQGHDIVESAEQLPAPTKVVDLMDALSASIDRARAGGTGPEATRTAGARRRAPDAKGTKPAAGRRAAKPTTATRTKKATPKPRRKAS